ncbi:hypothetical protein [uncultured Tolumonas sp.]|uniref:hypothetical protein n=1 Tax=uncultured Tolumonas sp. TaxID=263765 RepID=UPI00292E92DF|nr:hypothetical protein [uncultured Tolumonas sp.]
MKKLLLSLSLLLLAGQASAWTGNLKVTDNYFEGTGNNARLVLVVDQNFHTCGWNNAANIDLSQVGSEAYRTLVSVALAAMVSGRPLSLDTNSCAGDRASVFGLKLGMQ